MTDIYDRGRALAIRQLQPRPVGKGIAASLSATTGGTRDPATGTTTGATTSTYGTSGIRTTLRAADINGALVVATDSKFILSPVLVAGGDTPRPLPGWTLTFDGVVYRVVKSESWNWAGVPCGFVVYGRNQ